MLKIALKMLIGDRAKYLGIIIGLSFASFIISQQSAIFLGLMSRTYGFITDSSQADIWVMDPMVQFIDDIKPLKDTDLFRIRGVPGVEWATPLYKGLIKARLSNGKFQICNVIGIDDATLIGGPPQILKGDIVNLRAPDAVIINKVGAEDKLSLAKNRPLSMGDTLELNDKRAQVVGICEVSRTFQSQPVIYTTYNRAVSFAPPERKQLSFILVKADPKIGLVKTAENIRRYTGFAAYTQQEFKELTVWYFLTNTGILINFGITVLLGMVIGAAIVGQTFYTFIIDNIRYLAVLKAIGASNQRLIKMTLLQVLWTGLIGWGVGLGATGLFGFLFRTTELSFFLPWQLYVASLFLMLTICLISSAICFWKIYKIEPALAFRA